MATLNDCAVGDIVKLNVNGVATDFIIVHKGRPSTDYHSSCDGVWLLMKDTYEYTTIWGDNNDYENSPAHSFLNDTFRYLLDEDIRNALIYARIPYWKGTGLDGSLKKGTSGLRAYAFLLSLNEVNSDTGDGNPSTEGAKLDYFSDATSRKAYRNGTARTWALRSVDTDETTFSYKVTTYGSFTDNADEKSDIRPALILPYDLKVKNGFVVTSSFNGHVNVGGVWKEVSEAYVNVGGVWKEVSEAYMNIDGVWKPM